uniref:Uncharacterized protein n=1 Tax=Arundo donax TaxID=35708 RepID=A0A0A9H0Z3_ARUDO
MACVKIQSVTGIGISHKLHCKFFSCTCLLGMN